MKRMRAELELLKKKRVGMTKKAKEEQKKWVHYNFARNNPNSGSTLSSK